MFEKYAKETFYTDPKKAEEIIKYLLDEGANISEGVFHLNKGGKIKIAPYEGKVEIVCECKEEIINNLEKMVNEND